MNSIREMFSRQTIRDHDMFIGGAWQQSSDGRTFEVEDPFTGETWARVPEAGETDVRQAISAARDAFDNEWSQSLPSTRARALRDLGGLIERDARPLALMQVRENGKLLKEVLPQTIGLARYCYFFAGIAETLHGEMQPVSVPDTVAYTRREPMGVIGAVTPWNSPLALLMWKFAPAIAAGNTMVAKPSEVTPVSTLVLAELIEEAGFPAGVFNVVTGHSDAGKSLTTSTDIDRVAFTGSTGVGRDIAVASAQNFTRYSLELGGKSPNIVFPDADIDKAVSGVIKGVFSASGQTCVAGSRVLVHDSIYDEFVTRLVEDSASIKLGDPLEESSQMGTIACRTQLNKIEMYVDIGRKEGARLLLGGEAPSGADELSDGLFFLPTIFGDVNNRMRIAREEIFGPVMSILKFSDEDEAIDIANDTDYGLAAGLWTTDLSRAHRVSHRLRAGVVWVNAYRVTNYAVPFGGFGDSGVGRESGIDAVKDYTEVKTVWMNIG